MELSPPSKRTVYVLDDEPGIRLMLTHVLTASGYNVEQFSTGLELLIKARATRPEIIVLDLSLGHTDAIEVIRDLESIHFEGEILLISGTADPATLKDVRDVGLRRGLRMLPTLRKPFRSSDVKAALASASLISAMPDAAARTPITLDVQEAIDGKWLELWYQPKVDLRSMSVCGAEALARVNHPKFGVLSPAAFIPPARDPRHEPLAQFVIRQALGDWTRFEEGGLVLKIAINMPVSIIQSGEFLVTVREALPKSANFPGLIVEMTEDEVIRDFELIREKATQLKLYGISISVDDFGTAHSSLSRLFECPCAELKIDGKFVQNCASDALKRSLCRTIIDLAHQVEAHVCAEGIETVDDLKCLIDLGCDLGQGYLFARPMRAKQFMHVVREVNRLPLDRPDGAIVA